MADRRHSLELEYAVGPTITTVLYDNNRCSGPAVMPPTGSFTLAEYQASLADLKAFILACEKVCLPVPLPVEPGEYTTEAVRPGGVSTYEINIGDLTVEIFYGPGPNPIVNSYAVLTAWDITWGEFLFTVDALSQFIDNLVAAP